jgi:hypothetical protein
LGQSLNAPAAIAKVHDSRLTAHGEKTPDWLECDTVLELGGKQTSDRRRNYRDYVESAVREGLAESPWASLREQVVLGGTEFLAQLRGRVRGNDQEQRGARRLIQERPGLNEVIAAVEQVKAEKCEAFRDRPGGTADATGCCIWDLVFAD